MLKAIKTLLACSIFLCSSVFSANSIMVLGDSLSAGYGMDPNQSWVQLLANELTQKAPKWQVINNSVSGDTTGNGLARLPGSIQLHQPKIIIIELGGNDGLRGTPLAQIEKNLSALITTAKNSGAHVLLMEMRIPPNMGKRYTDQFTALFADIAKKNQIALIPFFLNDIAPNKELMQADGIHPNAKAQPLMMRSVFDTLEPFLQ